MQIMRRTLCLVMITALFAVTGCASWSWRARGPAKVTYPDLPQVPMPDLTTLTGRRICIDPGHGGPWTGALSPCNGLRESAVNLRVAMCLKDLLCEAGATVIMTRHGDYALHPESLADDLASRAAAANQTAPDVFISIHHNADIVKDSTKNDLEVYYRLGDDGPSLDLARCLTYALAQRLRPDAPAKRLLPGNYKVLRLTQPPAVLLESSYLTHRHNAAFLDTQPATDAEAKAILAGLASYFALDPPLIDGLEVAAYDQGRTHQLAIRFSRGYPIDGKSVQVRLNGRRTAGEYDFSPATLLWTFTDPLPNGSHHVEVTARNFLGAAATYGAELEVARPPKTIEVEQRPPTAVAGSGIELLIEARITDALGFPVADDTPVQAGDLQAQTRNGLARFYVQEDRLENPWTVQCGECSNTVFPLSAGPTYKTLRITNVLTGRPIAEALVTVLKKPVAVTTEEGWCAVPAKMDSIAIACRGYEPVQATLSLPHTNLSIEPVEQGVLHGRRIVLDPACGGRDPGHVSPFGTRSSDLNLDIAQRAAAYLRAAGAVVFLTRAGDDEHTDLQRVLFAEEKRPEIYITISLPAHTSESKVLARNQCPRPHARPFVGHYPESDAGARLAAAIARAMAIRNVTHTVAYVIQQTSCPSVWVQPATFPNANHATPSDSVDRSRRAAYTLYRGVLDYFRSGCVD